MTQVRQWTVGAPLAATPVTAAFTLSTPTDRPVGGDEVVFVETNHPTDRILDVTWRLDGQVVPNAANGRNLDLGARNLAAGTHALSATVTDPAAPGGASETRTWTVDNVLPTAPRELSEPLTSLSRVREHNVYFGEFDMGLEPTDDQPGFVVGEFRLNGDGWFNYFGFPEQPEGTPFTFSHSGKDVKALTYGNLGTGGLSKATFEQSFTDAHPSGGFEPGYGTHTVEHRAIDAAGNIGDADNFAATVLPGGSPACTTTLTGTIRRLVVTSGVTCVDGTVNGGIAVRPGASLVVSNGSRINGGAQDRRRGDRPRLRSESERRLGDLRDDRGPDRGGLGVQRVARGLRQQLGRGDDPERRDAQLRRGPRRQLDRRRSRLHRQRPGRHRLRSAEHHRRHRLRPVRGALTR